MTPVNLRERDRIRVRASLLAVALTLLGSTACRADEPPAPSSAEGRADPSPPLPPAHVRAWQVGLLRPDRLQHASLAFSSGLAIGLVTREPGVAAAGSLALGVVKELWDVRRGRGFDWVDLAADGIGAGVGAGATAWIRREPG